MNLPHWNQLAHLRYARLPFSEKTHFWALWLLDGINICIGAFDFSETQQNVDWNALGATIFGWKWYYEVTMETRGDDMTLAPYLALEVRVYDGLPHATLLHRVV